jgi:hypothetical protein
VKLINFSVLFLCFLLLQPVFAIEISREIYNEEIPIPKRKRAVILQNNIYDKEIPVPKRKKISKLAGNVEAISNSLSKKLTGCWIIPDGINYIKSFNVKIYLLLSPQGEIVTANVVDSNAYQRDTLFRSVADNAMRAIYKCSPFSDLPSEYYHLWREITLNFVLGE